MLRKAIGKNKQEKQYFKLKLFGSTRFYNVAANGDIVNLAS